jgi:hypothetical protein
MLRKLTPHSPSSISACLSVSAGWELFKKTLPQLFSISSPPLSNHQGTLQPPNLVLVVHGIGPQVPHMVP